jgi:type IV pilus assembly protein PilO
MLDNMKISDKEKTMLCVLGSIIVGFLYYQFLYLPQTDEFEAKVKTESEIKQKYDTAMNTINSIEDKKSDVKILKIKIDNESIPFYPTISEEKIIIELDKLLKDSGLKGSIIFQPIVSNSVETSKKEEKSLAQSSLKGIVDQYNVIFKDTEKTQQNKIVNDSTKSGTNNTNGNNQNGANSSSTKDAKKNTVQYLKCVVNFEVNSINLSSDASGVKGTISLEIYAVPKIDDELESYLKWDLTGTYGKNVPFSKEVASVTSTSIKETKNTNDFIASVKPTASDLPTIMMGKANDYSRTTYVYADSNSEEKVEMILTQEGDKYYYKYKTSKGTYPANYESLGVEFVPISKNIGLDILSGKRMNATDNSEIALKIVNKTDRWLVVTISGDDSNNPRVKIDGNKSNITVNNK